jgi:hypothetical protein
VRPRQRRVGKQIAWYLTGLLTVLIGLAVSVDWLWPALRDPDYDELQRLIRERQAEQPGRPLVLALGSSRTQMALWADRLNSPSDSTGPLVLNGAAAGAGPIMQRVVLGRLLRAGVRPRLLLFETMPMSFSVRNGSPIEERQKFGERYTMAELIQVWPYYAKPWQMGGYWLQGRSLPWLRRQGDVRDALGMHLPTGPTRYQSGRERDGWVPCLQAFPPEEIERMTRASLEDYDSALKQPQLAPGPLRALHDSIKLCQEQHIPIVLVAPPENQAFRTYSPAVEVQMDALRAVARELSVPLIDARTWIDDAHFIDGHHATRKGAEQYTDRLGREVIEPSLRSGTTAMLSR